MFDFVKRGRLVRRGLASRKTRRRRVRNELMRNLEYSPYAKVFIFALFAGGLAFLVFSGQQPELTKNFILPCWFWRLRLPSFGSISRKVFGKTREFFSSLALFLRNWPSPSCCWSFATAAITDS